MAYDDDFLSFRGPVLLTFMVANLLPYGIVVVQGRWRPLTRNIATGLSVVICAILTWAVLAGDIFQARPTDQLVKVLLVLIIIITLLDVGLRLRRARRHRVSFDPCT